MTPIFKIAVITAFLCGLYTCNSNKRNSSFENSISVKSNLLDTAKWFLGTWENKSAEDVYTEIWSLKNDSVYEGISTVVVMSKDTVFYESITLEQKNKDLFYTVSVKDQNKGAPVSFKLTQTKGQQLVFENPNHDFPTKITYSRITKDSLVATISGHVNGKEKMEQFPMKKIK